MTKNPQGPSEISLRGFIEAVGSAEEANGAVSTVAVAGGLEPVTEPALATVG